MTQRFSPAGLLLLLLTLPLPAFAQCETPFSANPPMMTLAQTDTNNLNKFITQEKNFIKKDLTETATYEFMARNEEFNDNILAWLNSWEPRLHDALKSMTKQLSVAQNDQTRALGSLMDGQMINEGLNKKNMKEAEARRRYRPSENACQMDSVSPGQTKAYELARAVGHGFELDDIPRRSNAKGTPSETGIGGETKAAFEEYKNYFCDNTKGDLGCAQPGLLPGKNKDLPLLLWGDQKTIDPANADNMRIVNAVMRYLVYPLAPDIIPPTAVASASGHQALLARRAENARTNVIYTALGQMIGERIGGSGLDVTDLRTKAGLPSTAASKSASYREIQDTMGRDRFLNPEYLMRIVSSPQEVVHEQGTINALRLEAMHDIYRRSEEMLFLTATDYSRDLDRQIPGNAVQAAPLTK